MNSTKPVLQIKNLTKVFPEKDGRTLTACQDISLDVYSGKTLAVVGESGCGKSTLIKMIMGMESPTKGSIRFHEKELTTLNKKQRRESYQQMQMVFQEPYASFHPKMKVMDIVSYQDSCQK